MGCIAPPNRAKIRADMARMTVGIKSIKYIGQQYGQLLPAIEDVYNCNKWLLIFERISRGRIISANLLRLIPIYLSADRLKAIFPKKDGGQARKNVLNSDFFIEIVFFTQIYLQSTPSWRGQTGNRLGFYNTNYYSTNIISKGFWVLT